VYPDRKKARNPLLAILPTVVGYGKKTPKLKVTPKKE